MIEGGRVRGGWSAAIESSEFRKGHPCFELLHQDSMSELEKEMSVIARSRLRTPESINSSTRLLKFSTPPSASTVGVTPARPREASRRR